MCIEMGFDADFKKNEDGSLLITKDNFYIITKIPIIILIKLLLSFDKNIEDNIDNIIGAYSISMNFYENSALNIISGRKLNNDGKISIQKFSLYYPNNNDMTIFGNNWPLHLGFSFRTASFKFNDEMIDSNEDDSNISKGRKALCFIHKNLINNSNFCIDDNSLYKIVVI